MAQRTASYVLCPEQQAVVLRDVLAERTRQDAKWGEQNHIPAWWQLILDEEVGEVAKAIQEREFDGGTILDVRRELIHVAAVAIQAVESIDRNQKHELSSALQTPENAL